jgi:hypothetical protein
LPISFTKITVPEYLQSFFKNEMNSADWKEGGASAIQLLKKIK